MSVYTDLETLLESTGYKVFANHMTNSVKQAIVYRSISQRMVGSMSGQTKVKIERIQISCYALKQATLVQMVQAVEDLLGYHDGSDFTSIPSESKVESFDENTSLYFSHRDYLILYKEI